VKQVLGKSENGAVGFGNQRIWTIAVRRQQVAPQATLIGRKIGLLELLIAAPQREPGFMVARPHAPDCDCHAGLLCNNPAGKPEWMARA